MAMVSNEVADPNLMDIDCFDEDCPRDLDSCHFHCKICNKHLVAQNKLTHTTSSKHLRALRNFVSGGCESVPTDVVDGNGSSNDNSKKELKLPDRQDQPLIKCRRLNGPGEDQFHTKDVPREYQIEIFHKARDHDAICYLPTGTGKTLVSAMMIDLMLGRNPCRPVLFIVDKVLLVLQQSKYLQEQLVHEYTRYGKQRRSLVAAMCGGKLDTGTANMEEIDVLVATAGVVQNLLAAKCIRWCDFSLIVIDEIHHCEKGHPYKRLLNDYHIKVPDEKRPKIFGMTASPGAETSTKASLSRLRNLLRSIGNAKLCKVESNVAVLEEHQSQTTLEFVYAEMSESEKALQSVLQKHLLMCYRYVVLRSNIASLGIGIVISDRRPEEHNKFEFDGENLVRLRDCLELVTARPSDVCQVRNVLDHLYVVCSALMGLTICGDVAAYNVLQDLLELESPKGFKSIGTLVLKTDILAIMVRGNCTNLNVKGYVRSAIEKGQNMSAYAKLMDIILMRVNWASRREGKQPVVLILVKERGTAQFLTEILQSNDSLRVESIKVASLLGHGGKGSGGGMSVAQQTRVLGGIRDYLYQIVVATSVAEEGLDLPSCDVVIELDPPSGVTSLVQIRGRARQKYSRLFPICRDASHQVKIERLLAFEKCMYEAVDIICEEQERGEWV